MAMFKLCSCGKTISLNQFKCSTCQTKHIGRHKLYDKYKRDKDSTAFYKSKPWCIKRREALIRDKGLCQHCLKAKRIKQAEMVDHIIPIKEDWSLRLTLSNLQSLCNACHNKKTAEDKKLYKR